MKKYTKVQNETLKIINESLKVQNEFILNLEVLKNDNKKTNKKNC